MLPPDITTATVTFGKVASVVGRGAKVSLTVTPSHDLVWAATGDAIAGFTEAADVDEGIIGQIELPHTDQEGFITRTGRTITDWHYVAVAIASLGGQRRTWRWAFSLLTGQDTVDLDLLPTDGTVVAPGIGTLPEVTSVNGQTGAVIIGAGGGGSVTWQTLPGKPTTFPPDEHEHPDYLTADDLPPAPDLSGYVLSDDTRLTDARTPLEHDHDGRYVAVVRHGGDPGAARPAANVVWWIGSVEPANALAHDAWDDSEVAP